MGSPTGPSRVVILTDSPTEAEKNRDLPKRAATSEPDGSTSKEEREREISFHQEAIRQLIEGGSARHPHLTKVNIISLHLKKHL